MFFVNIEDETKPKEKMPKEPSKMSKEPSKEPSNSDYLDVLPSEIQKLFAVAAAIQKRVGGPYYVYRKRSMVLRHVSQAIAWLNLVVGCTFYILVRTTAPVIGQGIVKQIGVVASCVFFADIVVIFFDIVFLDILYTSEDPGPFAPLTRRYVFSGLLNIAFNLMVLILCVGPLAVAKPADFTCVMCFLYTVCAFVFVRTFEPQFEAEEKRLKLEEPRKLEGSSHIEIRIHTPGKIIRYI